MSTVQRSRAELAGVPIEDAVTGRGKELAVGETVASARRLFSNPSVEVIPVLERANYVGAVVRAAVHTEIDDGAPIGSLARDMLPTCRAGTLAPVALAALDESGANRLVVLDDHGETYLGLVCLRSDRQRLCIDAECHAQPSSSIERDM